MNEGMTELGSGGEAKAGAADRDDRNETGDTEDFARELAAQNRAAEEEDGNAS